MNWQDHEHELTLFTPKEFNFKENLNYLTRSSIECMYVIKEERIYKAISVGQENPIIEINANAEDNLVIRFLGDSAPPSKMTRTAVADYVWEWFDLERDLVPFYGMAKKDSLLKRTADSFYGLRIMGIPDLFEALCWGILGQQINLTFAYTLKRRLVEKFGRCVEFEGESYWLFPTPSAIAHLSVEELLELRMTVKKCEYLIEVANLMVEGKLSKEMLLDSGNLKSAEKRLVSIRGIGPWTANYVLMRCLRFPEAFPIDDVGLQNAIKHILGMDKKPTKDEISHLATNWHGWEAYATFYLWRVLY
ncbi:DNA-3-methyladenine glycosylase family protein [Bacillus salipaludis]|uniref:DNA-3-methyladenine glycosylase family protein n=1 Tax=Bacillus salipaludis TaxID=2547811 RepID=UPI003D1AA523